MASRLARRRLSSQLPWLAGCRSSHRQCSQASRSETEIHVSSLPQPAPLAPTLLRSWRATWLPASPRPLAACTPAVGSRQGPEPQRSNADCLSVVVIACTAGIASCVLFLARDPDKPVKVNVKAGELSYLCEGSASLLCAYAGKRADWHGRLLQLAKETPGDASGPEAAASFRVRAEVQRRLALQCFDPCVVDRPELVSLPEQFVGLLEASLSSSRPEKCCNQHLLRAARPLSEGSGIIISDSPGRVLGLRFNNLFEVPPPPLRWSGGASKEKLAVSLLTLELRPGCGLREVEGLPSRDALSIVNPGGEPKELEPLLLFGTDGHRAAGHLMARLSAPSADLALRVFVDGKPMHPIRLPAESADTTAEKHAEIGELAGVVKSCGFSCRVDDLLNATAAALIRGGKRAGPLSDLRRLQCFATGEAEKIAADLFTKLETHGGKAAISALCSIECSRAAMKRASWQEADKARMETHERQGQKLAAATNWGDRQANAVKDWLSLFLLGRAAMEARVLVSFAAVGTDLNAASEKQLRAFRFRPLKELLPGRPWCGGVWVCVTLTGLDRREPAQIPQLATELENRVKRYRS